MDSRLKTELREANEQCMTMLIDMATRDGAPSFDLLRIIAPQLKALDREALVRVSERPYLLVDFRFQDTPWWHSLESGNASTSDTLTWNAHAHRAAFDLAQRALTLAWHSVDTQRAAAILNLGISPGVADTLRHLPLQEINRIADTHVHAMTPPWLNRPLMWCRLLDAAKDGRMESLRFVDRLGAQLLAADLLTDPA